MNFWLIFHRIVCGKSAKKHELGKTFILESQPKKQELGIQMPQNSRNTE